MHFSFVKSKIFRKVENLSQLLQLPAPRSSSLRRAHVTQRSLAQCPFGQHPDPPAARTVKQCSAAVGALKTQKLGRATVCASI